MAAEAHAPTASEYIVHHLQHLQNVNQTKIVDFTVINYDSIIVGLVLGALTLLILWSAARKATSGVPGRFQAAVEMLVEMVDNQAKANIPSAESRTGDGEQTTPPGLWIKPLPYADDIRHPPEIRLGDAGDALDLCRIVFLHLLADLVHSPDALADELLILPAVLEDMPHDPPDYGDVGARAPHRHERRGRAGRPRRRRGAAADRRGG